MASKRKLYRVQYRHGRLGGGWETVEWTRSEREAWYLYRESRLAYCNGNGGEVRLVTTNDEVLAEG